MRALTEHQKSTINSIINNVITNVAHPEYIHIDGVNLPNTDISAGVAVVTMSEYDKIADVIGLATGGRIGVVLAPRDIVDVHVIALYDTETDELIAVRNFKIEGL